MCGKGFQPSDYDGYIASRASRLEIPINIDVVAHEVLRSLYKSVIKPADKNYTGFINIAVSMPVEEIPTIGTLENNVDSIGRLAIMLSRKFGSNHYENIDKEDMAKTMNRAVKKYDREDSDDDIAISISGSTFFAIEKKEHKEDDYIVTDKVIFYLHLPRNIKIGTV